ncbi:MAG: CHASE domain-containing protein, partial [Moraxellaceae bacterium]|nr:CHASE domain-containing protein [Moraxellaceae bacterium]
MAQGPAAFLPRLRASGYQQALIVLTVGIALSLGLSLWVATQVDRQVQDRFERLGQRQIERIQSRIELYTYGLKGVRGIFAEQPGLITEAHFRAYSQSRDLPREFPGATAWGFAERLPASVGNIQALLARQGVERYFRFDGQAAPAAGQDAWVVRLIEPPAARAGLLGIDLASEPARQATALDAMQRGQPALSPLLAPDAQSAAPHFLFLLPVYGSSIAHPGNVAGWVFARLDAEAVFAFLGAEAGLAEHLELDILDTTQKGEPQPLFSLRQGQGSLTTNRHRLRTAMPLSRQHTLDVGGRRWAVHITGRPALYSGAERWLPPLALAIGTLITLIVAGLIGLNSSRRGEAEDRARRTAVSLREREAQLQSTLTSLDDWVFVLDAEGRVLDCHEPSHHPAWLARNDFMNQPLATVLPPAAQAEFEHALREIRTHLYTTFEFSLHNQNHSRHFVARLSARRLEDGQLDGTTLVARDVTRERAQDRDVRASEEKFRSVFAEAPQAIVLSLQNRHVDANAAALRLFGIPNLSAMQHSAMGMLSPL